MNEQEMDDIFAKRAREVFLASTGSLKPDVLARLGEARRAAVAAAEGTRAGFHLGWRIPAGAVALAFVAVIGGALWTEGNAPAPGSSFSAANTDAPMMMTGDSLDMYADMDFYQWLANQDQPAQAPAADTTVDDSEDDDDPGVGG
ncbi:MAG TPA: hypothetical protein VGH71_01795 [Gammaproteobacteria bacterium]